MKKLLYISSCCLLMAMATGCKKYLEQLPDNRSTLNTPEKVSELLVSAYPKAGYSTFCEAMSDNVNDVGTGTAYAPNSDSYFWQDVQGTAQDAPEYYWNACYEAIASANQALDAIAKVTDPDDYSAQKGEALVARAYSHFMLVSIFSKMYDSATAATDLGIPYVTGPETVVIKKYERKTVQYVYDMIAKDLEEGLPLIQDKTYEVPKYHFTQKAAHAFASRFYLYAKQYSKAIQHASAVMPSEGWADNMRPWLTTYASASSSTEIATSMNNATLNANLLLTQTTSWWARYYKSYRYATGASMYNVLKATNITNGTYAFRWYSWSSGTYYATPKYNEFFVYSTATTGVGYVMFPAITVEEALFNRAEAKILSGDNAGAMADLNVWVKARVKSYVSASNDVTEARVKSFYQVTDLKTGLINTILDMKRIEFLHEGLRWFDNLRYHMPVTHTIYNGDPMTLPDGDLRRVVQIPQEAASMGGLELNPR